MEEFSIDECFLDMTEIVSDSKQAVKIAHVIKDRIKNELGFTVNVGIGENKLCAKMASDFEKPNKVHALFLSEVTRQKCDLCPLEIYFMLTEQVRKN